MLTRQVANIAVKHTSCIRYNSTNLSSNLAHLLGDCFGFTSLESLRFVRKNKLEGRDSEQILSTIESCRRLGFSDQQIIKTPNLLKYHATLIEQRCLILEEGGFRTITPQTVTKYRKLYNQRIEALKDNGYIAESTDVCKNFINYLDPCPSDFQIDSASDHTLWSVAHRHVVIAYLAWRLDTSTENIEHMLRIHRVVGYKCMRFLCENIRIAEELGIKKEKIVKCGYLLQSYPKNTRELLRDLSNIAGGDLKSAMRRYPKLMMIPAKNFIQIYGILKEYGIEDKVIKKQMNIFGVAPETVRFRLEEISKTKEMKVLLSHPGILQLVVHHTRAKQRLTYLQNVQFKCANMMILGGKNETFDRHIQKCRDANSTREILVFLNNIFHEEINSYRRRWQKHPRCLSVPLTTMQATYDYLKKSKFQTRAIYRMFHILLYTKESIMIALDKIKSCKDYNWINLTQVQKLALILYYIEVDFGFRGAGIEGKADEVLEEKTK